MLTPLQNDLLLDVYEARNIRKSDLQIIVDAALVGGVPMERVQAALSEPPTQELVTYVPDEAA